MQNQENQQVDDKILEKALEAYSAQAEEIIEDEDRFERLIQRLEETMKKLPKVGKYLSDITCMVSLVRSYIKKEYKDVPINTIVSIVAVLIYIVSPIDLIPDTIPVAGQIDDVAIFLFVLPFISLDVEEYKKWRKANGKQLIEETE